MTPPTHQYYAEVLFVPNCSRDASFCPANKSNLIGGVMIIMV